MAARRRPGLVWLLFVLFIVVPLVEIYVIIQVGQTIGPWWTILLLVADSVIGSWLVKREGGRTFRALREAIRSGRVPARELADGGLVLVGGTLMLTPGFVTDAFALLLILPVTRPVLRRLLTRVVSARLVVSGPLGTPPGTARRPGQHPAGPGPTYPGANPPGPTGPVVRGEVVDD